MITFNKPCLRWKLIGGRKIQPGWPGYLPPNHNRYLRSQGIIKVTPTAGYGTSNQAPTTTYTWDMELDREGQTISSAGAIADSFPYGAPLPLPEDPVHSEKWTVSDASYDHTYNNGYNVIDTSVTLSKQYSIGQLDADCDALIATIDPGTVPWGGIQIALDSHAFATGDPTGLIPAEWNYQNLLLYNSGTLSAQVPLRAAAYSAFGPGQVAAEDWFPNAGIKLIGYIAMAGNFCVKTFTLDDAQNLLNETCQSRVGSCAANAAIKIIPPPLNDGAVAYLTATPNCQCGG